MSNRILKVNEVIKEELSNLLLKEVDFAPDILVTITRADTSKDLGQTKIYLSVLPTEKSNQVLKKLEKEVFNLQKILNKRLDMRPVPKIRFEIDQSIKHAERIEELLKEIKNEK